MCDSDVIENKFQNQVLIELKNNIFAYYDCGFLGYGKILLRRTVYKMYMTTMQLLFGT